MTLKEIIDNKVNPIIAEKEVTNYGGDGALARLVLTHMSEAAPNIEAMKFKFIADSGYGNTDPLYIALTPVEGNPLYSVNLYPVKWPLATLTVKRRRIKDAHGSHYAPGELDFIEELPTVTCDLNDVLGVVLDSEGVNSCSCIPVADSIRVLSMLRAGGCINSPVSLLTLRTVVSRSSGYLDKIVRDFTLDKCEQLSDDEKLDALVKYAKAMQELFKANGKPQSSRLAEALACVPPKDNSPD